MEGKDSHQQVPCSHSWLPTHPQSPCPGGFGVGQQPEGCLWQPGFWEAASPTSSPASVPRLLQFLAVFTPLAPSTPSWSLPPLALVLSHPSRSSSLYLQPCVLPSQMPLPLTSLSLPPFPLGSLIPSASSPFTSLIPHLLMLVPWLPCPLSPSYGYVPLPVAIFC